MDDRILIRYEQFGITAIILNALLIINYDLCKYPVT